MDPQRKYCVSITSFTTLIPFLKGVLYMSPCDYPNSFWVSIFKNKNLEFRFHGSISIPWFDFANFCNWVDARSNTYLSFKGSEPIRTSYTVFEYSPLKFAYHFSVNLVCLYTELISPRFTLDQGGKLCSGKCKRNFVFKPA